MQSLSIFGAFCLLLGYYLTTSRSNSRRCELVAILLNVVGSGILMYIAIDAYQYGFILLEGIWSLISVRNLFKFFVAKSE